MAIRGIVAYCISKVLLIVQWFMDSKVEITAYDLFLSRTLPHHALTKYINKNSKTGMWEVNPDLEGEALSSYQELIKKINSEEIRQIFSDDDLKFLELVGNRYRVDGKLVNYQEVIPEGFDRRFVEYCNKYEIKFDIDKTDQAPVYQGLEKLEEAILQHAGEDAESYEQLKEWLDTFLTTDSWGEWATKEIVERLGEAGGELAVWAICFLCFIFLRNHVATFVTVTYSLSFKALKGVIKYFFSNLVDPVAIEKNLNFSNYLGIRNLATHLQYLKSIDKSVEQNSFVQQLLGDAEFGIDAKLQKMTACLSMPRVGDEMSKIVKNQFEKNEELLALINDGSISRDDVTDVTKRLKEFGEIFSRFLSEQIRDDVDGYSQAVDQEEEMGERVEGFIQSESNAIQEVLETIANDIASDTSLQQAAEDEENN